jgi:hypothetical protein
MEKKQTSGKSAGEGTATVGDVTISGQSHSTVGPFTVEITLDNDTFNLAISAGDNVKDWFAHWPSGDFSAIVAEVEPGGTTITITVSGIPDVGSARDLEITIPEDVLEDSDSPITVTPNPDAKFDITAVIIDETDLQNFAEAVNGGDVKQNAKLQSSTTVIDARTGVPDLPISRDYAHAYEGDFDGSGGKIKIDLVSKTGFLALFGINKGIIHDLTVCGSVTLQLDPEVEEADYIAGVVAYNDIYGTITRVINNVAVTAATLSPTQLETTHNIGGIAGFNGWDRYNDDSPHYNELPPDQPVGIISKCRNEGAIEGGFNKIGGIAGENAGDIEECSNKGDITCVKGNIDRGWPGVGGITGRNGNNNISKEKGHILNCYNRGIINDNADTGAAKNGYGGITGWCDIDSDINNCYTTGEIKQKGNRASSGEANPIIGMVDTDPPNTDNNYSLNCIFASSEDPELTGERMESEDMKEQEFVEALNTPSGGPYILGGDEDEKDYPILSWEAEASKREKGKGKK